MAKRNINIGTQADDGTGNILRNAFEKTRDNFDELYEMSAAHVSNYGAIGDGISHPLSEFYTTLEEAQVDYPHATDLSDEMDWAAIQKCIDERRTIILGSLGNTYMINRPLIFPYHRTVYCNNCTLKASDYTESIMQVNYKIDTHGYLLLDGDEKATNGMLINGGGRSNFDNIVSRDNRIWGVHVAQQKNNNGLFFNQIKVRGNGVRVNAIANADPDDPFTMVLTITYFKHFDFFQDLVNNNKYNQFEFIVDDSGYNRNGGGDIIPHRRVFMAEYEQPTINQYPVEQDPDDPYTIRVKLRPTRNNMINSDYVDRPVLLLFGGGLSFFKKSEGMININQFDTASEPIGLSMGITYGGFIGNYISHYNEMLIASDYIMGLSIGYLYAENLGQNFTHEPYQKGIFVCTYYDKTRITILSIIGNKYFKEKHIAHVASAPPSADNTLIVFQEMSSKLTDENVSPAYSTYRKAYNERSSRVITQKRFFNSSKDTIVLSLVDIEDVDFNGFSPLVFYFKKKGGQGFLRINLTSTLRNAGYTIRGAGDNGKLEIPASTLPDECRVTIILFEKEFTTSIETLHVNQVVSSVLPLILNLSKSNIEEGNLVGDTVGELSVLNKEDVDTYTFEFATGTGDTDNGSFTIDGDLLKAGEVFDYDVKSEYSIRVKAIRQDNAEIEKSFTITIDKVWVGLTDFTLSNNTLEENPEGDGQGSYDEIGIFEKVGAEAGNEYTYELVSGTGDEGNDSFTIDGDSLFTNDVYNYETQSEYNIRVRVTDLGDNILEKNFTIYITNINEPPTDIDLSNTSIDENNSVGDAVGVFTTTDADLDDTHTYTLVSGVGDDDNNSFEIVGDELRATEVFDYENKSSYSIRVRTTDPGNLSFEKQFTISINDVYEGSDNEPEVNTYISELTTDLSTTQIDKLNILVSSLKTELGITALSDAFDVIYAIANETSEAARLNLVKRQHDFGTAGLPEFTASRGYKGDGVSTYINTNYNPATEGANYTLNDASFGIFFDEIIDDGEVKLNGSWVSPSSGRTQLSNASFGINGVTTSSNTTPLGINGGMKIVSRNSANSLFSLNNSEITEADIASDVIPNKDLYLLAINYDNDDKYHETSRLGFAFVGKYFTPTEASKIKDIIYTYMGKTEPE